MRVFDNGSSFTVTCTRRDVAAFKRAYPCSDIPDIAIAFEFEKRNGDLCGIQCRRDTAEFDGPALVALSIDAYEFGEAHRVKYYRLVWAPEGKPIAEVEARNVKRARRMAPLPYRRYLGEIAVIQLDGVSR